MRLDRGAGWRAALDAVAREQVADALACLGVVVRRVFEHGDHVGVARGERQRFGEDVDRLVDVVVVASDLDANPRPAQQAAHRRRDRRGRVADARQLAEQRLSVGFVRRIFGVGQQRPRLFFEIGDDRGVSIFG